MSIFGTLNWVILIGYVVVNLLLGFRLGKNISSADDFYVGRKTTPWWAIGISVVATYVSAMTFLGAPAWAYKEGLSVIAIHINYPIVIFLVITFFIPFFFNSGVVSIYEYLEKRFGTASRVVIAVVFMISQALSSASVLYGTSIVIGFITGIDIKVCIILVTIIALIYTAMGGITAVIWTDVIQAGVLLVGAGIIMYTLLDYMPSSFGEIMGELKAQGKTKAVDWSGDFTKQTTIWAGVIAMSLYHVTVYGANQMMVQRTLASKNIGDAKKSFLMMGFAAFFIYFFFILLGVLFYGYYGGKEFENPNTIILNFATEHGFKGLMGIIAAAVVAASMSSLDSAFNSLSTISTVGFYQKFFKPNESEEHYLKATRWFTIIWAIIIIIPALILTQYEELSILELLSKVGSYFVGAKLSMYALGFFSKHTTQRGLLVGVVAGFVALALTATLTDISWPWYALIGGGVNIIVSIPLSIVIDGFQKEWSVHTIRGQKKYFKENNIPLKEGGWYKIPGGIDRINYVLLGFFVITLLFILFFEDLF